MFRESDASDSRDDELREAPTLPPPTELSVVRYKVGVSVDELSYRLSVGDVAGAMDPALSLLEEAPIPIVVLPPTVMAQIPLDHQAEYLLSFVDGEATLDDVVKSSGMPLLDALRAVCDMVEKGILALR